MAKHVTYKEAIRKAANGGWGQKFSTMAEAEKSVIDDDKHMAGLALLDIVRRFNKMIEALHDDDDDYDKPDNKKPEDAKAFPGVKLGDILYTLADDELTRYVVVAIEDGDYVRTVEAQRGKYYAGKAWVKWGTEGEFTSLADAVAYALKPDDDGDMPDTYHRKKIAAYDALREAMEVRDDAKMLAAVESL